MPDEKRGIYTEIRLILQKSAAFYHSLSLGNGFWGGQIRSYVAHNDRKDTVLRWARNHPRTTGAAAPESGGEFLRLPSSNEEGLAASAGVVFRRKCGNLSPWVSPKADEVRPLRDQQIEATLT